MAKYKIRFRSNGRILETHGFFKTRANGVQVFNYLNEDSKGSALTSHFKMELKYWIGFMKRNDLVVDDLQLVGYDDEQGKNIKDIWSLEQFTS